MRRALATDRDIAEAKMPEERYARFVDEATVAASAPLVPEVRLRLARDSHAIFADAERFERPAADRFPPYWAFAWPGGQAIARYIIDNPVLVAGRRVIDIGAGSGIAAIAAQRAGAARVLAVDIDPLATIAIGRNAALNGCPASLTATTRDVLGETPEADLVILSDLVYEPELMLRVGAFIEDMTRAGRQILMGDRSTSRQPASGLEELARFEAPLCPALLEGERQQAPRATPSGRSTREQSTTPATDCRRAHADVALIERARVHRRAGAGQHGGQHGEQESDTVQLHAILRDGPGRARRHFKRSEAPASIGAGRFEPPLPSPP